MKYIFLGSPRFAEKVLEKLLDCEWPPLALIANPDRPAGRKQIITPPLTKKLIEDRGLSGKVKILQPEKLKDILPDIAALQPDFFIVAAYAKILRPETLAIPKLGTIGIHPSLLPKYRGASPIQSALLADELETGVALYKMGEGVDDGPVYECRPMPTGQMNYPELQEALAELAGEMLVEFLPRFVTGRATMVKQPEHQATLTRKFTTEDGFVDFADLKAALAGDSAKSHEIYRKIRALTPEPGVWTLKEGKRIKLLNSQVVNGGNLRLITIQEEGKKPEDFRGF
jgi:methionyl-tRNA formyltransferase